MMKKDQSSHTASVYDKIARVYQDTFDEPTDFIEEFIEMVPGNGAILDVGCGVGTDSVFLHDKGFHVIGIDLSSGMIEIARNRHPKIEFRIEDLREPKFPDCSFEGIIGSFSLIHIPKEDVPATLSKYNKLLKENSVLFLVLQGGPSEELFVDEPYKPEEKTFLNIFSEAEIKKELEKAGFAVVKMKDRPPEQGKEFNYQKLFVWAKKK